MVRRTILVALGANLPDPAGRSALDTCRWAAEQLGHLPGLRLDAVSRWFRTAPVPASDQPDFINGVAMLAGKAEPEALLACLHAIEARAGRVRSVANAARVLDVDLLAIDGLVRPGPAPVLPHPRLAERAFVLYPLCDVAPDWRHPVLGETALALREKVDARGVTPA